MTTTLPAGRYWIGDPCYYVNDDNWHEVCEQCFKPDNDDRDGIWIELENLRFILIGTAYGDGVYELKRFGTIVANLGVDAGCLSIIPTTTPPGNFCDGYVVEMKKPFTADASKGNFTFGEYSVITDGSDYEEEEEDFDFPEDENDS